MFSSLVTGLNGSRRGRERVSPDTPEPIVPSQKASMSASTTPADADAAVAASTSRSSVDLSQCSPKAVQPMPTMATWSLMPCDPITRPSLRIGHGRAFQK